MAYSSFSTNSPTLDRITFNHLPPKVLCDIQVARELTREAFDEAKHAHRLISNYHTRRTFKATIIDKTNRARRNFLIVYAILACIQHLHPFLLHWFECIIRTLKIIPIFYPFNKQHT
jgi:hypothetical protein